MDQFLDDYKTYYFDGSEPEKGSCFTIIVQERAIGAVIYNEIDRSNDSVELDIIIADEKDTNKGYGTDALKSLSKHLIKHMHIKTLYIIPLISNYRAIKSYQNAGFRIIKPMKYEDGDCYYMELKKNRSL